MGRALVASLLLAGCGFSGAGSSNLDGGVDGSMMVGTCGDGLVQPELGELCDPAASAEEQCPLTCADANVCSRGVPMGPECAVQCVQVPISEPISGDGCCPPGANSTTDADCLGVCGNNTVEPGEVCDGNCPTSCVDGMACTADVLIGSGCSRSCDNPIITTAMNGDACCPSGANANIDNDCNPVCGNGVVETAETCDGNCPTSCIDGDLCTADELIGTACTRACMNTPITEPASNDQCCPSGANANIDNDCQPQCGNGVIEFGELCDGACPTSCMDGVPCTRDILEMGGTCRAFCRFEPITERIDGDGCCIFGTPPGQDSDCQ